MQRKYFLLLLVLLAACRSTPVEIAPEPTLQIESTPTPEPEPEPIEEPTPVFSSNPYNDGMLARRNGDYARAIAAFQLTLNSNPAPELKAEAQFRLGEMYWLNADYSRAIDALNAYLQANPNGTYADETRYFAGDAYRAKKDYANALAQFRLYRDQSQALVGDIDALIADIMVSAGDSANAIAQYDRALQDATLAASTRISILRRAADVHVGLGQPALAAGRYDAALAWAGDARTKADLLQNAGDAYSKANKIDQALARWNEAINKYPEQPGAYQSLVDVLNRNVTVDDYQRGVINFNAGVYDGAITAFERDLKNNSARAGDDRFFIATARARKGLHAQAITDFDALIKALPKDKRVPEAYLGKATALAALGKLDDAVAAYKKFADTFPEHERADDALWSAAQLYDRADRYADAAKIFELAQSKFPGRERAAEALFWAGYDYYRLKDSKTANARWTKIVQDYQKSTSYARALFWLGKSAQARGATNDAKNFWTQAAAANGYYAWRAQDALAPKANNATYDTAQYAMFGDADRAEFEKWLAGWTKVDARNIAALDDPTRKDARFRRGAELMRLDRTVDARREFAALVEAKKENPTELYALALFLRDNNQYSLALDCGEKIARLATSAGAPAAPRLLWQLRYPTYYADLVVAEANKNNIDPLLYFALIRQESSFNPWVTSSADARGLAQIIPATGKEIANRLRVKNFSLDQLYRPYVSVRFGVWYLAQDLKTYGEPIYALIAYNAGGARVKRWQNPDIDAAVEDIDIRETSLYVNIVYSNWRQYQAIYR